MLPNEHVLRDEQIELVPSPDESHLLFEDTHTAAHTSVDVSNVVLFEVRSQDVLNEVVEVVAGFRQLVVLELLVEHKLEVVQ